MREILNLSRLLAMPPAEAAALLSARMRDPTGDQDSAVLEEWLAHDARHPTAWKQAQQMLAIFAEGEDDEILRALREEALKPAAVWSSSLSRWGALAAGVIIVLLGAVALQFAQPWTKHGQESAQIAGNDAKETSAPATVIEAGRGQIRKLVLPDGSALTLDSDSAIRLAFSPERRTLYLLRGRASFQVRRATDRPFAVRADGREVVALGTQFEVTLRQEKFSVVLFEGRVGVTIPLSGSKQVELRPGQQLVQRTGEPAKISQADPDDAAQWQNGVAIFKDATLAEVVAELNSYTSEQIVIRDPAVARLRITGALRTGNLARFARTITAMHPVKVVRRSDIEWEIVLLSAKEKNRRPR